jgi:hypothetical protein
MPTQEKGTDEKLPELGSACGLGGTHARKTGHAGGKPVDGHEISLEESLNCEGNYT